MLRMTLTLLQWARQKRRRVKQLEDRSGLSHETVRRLLHEPGYKPTLKTARAASLATGRVVSVATIMGLTEQDMLTVDAGDDEELLETGTG